MKNLKKVLGIGGLILGLTLTAGLSTNYLRASDHDDGETEIKGRNLNLTDLFVFREKDQKASASNSDLIFIMDTNPRSLAGQQYYFSTRARYEFNVTRVTDNDSTPTGKPNVVLRFEFLAPNNQGRQPIKITSIRDGITQVASQTLMTTPVKAAPTVGQVTLGGSNLAVFAGLREDPFFFDVEQFFKVRAAALNAGRPVIGFRPPNQAVDFAKGYNVNAIAVRVPIKFLQGNTTAKTFDVWETIAVPSTTPGKVNRVERLARPAINEGLIFTNAYLNTLNMVGPDFEAAALAGQQPAANQAKPIVEEAIKTLKALGNNDARAGALVQAFLPDVMRIDTTQASNYDVTIPLSCLNAKGSPICGRKLKDDVVDITLRVLTNGAVPTDNVSYEGTPGNPSQGHQPLAESFPYLAPAN